ncbi:GNAT family N-acetyltransferase [soil metagenome]
MNRAYRGDGDAAAGWASEQAYIRSDRTSAALLRADLAAHPDAAMLKWVDAPAGLDGRVWLEPRGDGVWYLGSLTIDPGRQNAGFGRIMLAAGETEPFPYGDERFGTPLRDDLCFVVVEKTLGQ